MGRLRVGLDVTLAGIAEGERSGVYQYQRHLVRELLALDQLDLTLLFALPRARHLARIESFVQEVCPTPRLRPRVRRGRLPLRLLRHVPVPAECWGGVRLDLLHAPAHLLGASLAPGVVTVHDLAYLHDMGQRVDTSGLAEPERAALALRQRFFSEVARHTASTVQRAAHVITVSEFTRVQLMDHFGLAANRVTAVPLGLRPEAVAEVGAAQARDWRQRLKLPPRFVLYLGNIDPNKNLATLLRGYAHYRHLGGRAALVLAGRSVFYRQVLERLGAQLGLGDAVQFAGRVEDDALPVLYRAAQALVMPSRLEGFGLPAIEAMACGVPVVVSNAGALPEVVGDAALAVHPDDAAGFGEALYRLEGDPALAEGMHRAGVDRAAWFSWQRTAAATADVYRRVAAARA